jgi:uncharacterized protein YdhG (YjbR/CyaY superfamily)
MDEDPGVSDYIGAAPEPDRATLSAWRDLCRTLPEPFAEGVRYGMPGYSRDGEVEIAFARQKRYLSLYLMRTDVLDASRDRLRGCSTGKGCVRFPLGRPTDLDLVATLVAATGASRGPVC